MSQVSGRSTSGVQQLFVRDASGSYIPAGVAEVVGTAKNLIGKQLARKSRRLNNPEIAIDWLRFNLWDRSRETFCVIYLDAQHRVLKVEELFHGTLTTCAVYPREVAKHALIENAANVIACHNHPSSCPDPSEDDIAMTKKLKEVLSLIEVNVIDHIVIGGGEAISMAKRGLI